VNLVEQFLSGETGRAAVSVLPGFSPAGSIVITPRYPDSRHVVVLVVDGTGRPRVVGKVVRATGDTSTLGREAQLLGSLDGSGVPPGSVPRLLAFENVGGHWILVQTALRGRAVTHADARADPDRWWALVTDWLAALPVGPQPEPAAWLDGYLGDSLRLAASVLEPTAQERDAFLATEHFLSRFAQAGFRTVVEHGDLSHPNVLWSRRGIAVVDWETGHRAGVVGADAAVFLSFLEFAKAGVHGRDGEARVYAEQLLRPGAQARDRLIAYLAVQQIGEEWVDHVLLAAWSRICLAVFPRLLSGQARSGPVLSGPALSRPALSGPVMSGQGGGRGRDLACRLFRASRSSLLWNLTLERLNAVHPAPSGLP
jgi:aminoglycoside phosphotransferase